MQCKQLFTKAPYRAIHFLLCFSQRNTTIQKEKPIMVTRKHVKIVNILTIAFGVMTAVSLALFIAGIWPVWNIFANAFAMNSLGLLSHVFTTVVLHEEIYDRMRTNYGLLSNEIEMLRMAMVFPDSLTKLRKDCLASKARLKLLILLTSPNSPLSEDIHTYTFRLGANYDGNPVFMSVPVTIKHPHKDIGKMEGTLMNFVEEEAKPALKKLVDALIKDREYDKFEFDDKLTVDIIPVEDKKD